MLKTALIFAAGRGERLQPLTLATPKPMIKIGEHPLIHYHIQKCINAKFQRIIINHAYLGFQIKQYVKQHFQNLIQIDFFAEPSGGLETGGTLAAISKAGLIDDELLLTINADIVTDYSFTCNQELAPNMNAKLVLIPTSKDYPQKNFGIIEHQIVTCESPEYTFSGLAIYRVAALKNLPIGRYSIRDWLFSQAKKQKLVADVYKGYWQDIGSFERLEQVRKFYSTPA